MVVVRGDNDGSENAPDDSPGWTGDESPLQHLVEYVAPGSRLTYDYHPTATIRGILGGVSLAPLVGAVKYADHHEYITGLHFISNDKRCLLDYNELVGFVAFLERILNPECHEVAPSRPRVKVVRYETRNGFVLELGSSHGGEWARLSIASPVTILLSLSNVKELFQACQAVREFLNEFRP